jgi:delta 1-pyrroline-5-carboxylate dehydrogenase
MLLRARDLDGTTSWQTRVWHVRHAIRWRYSMWIAQRHLHAAHVRRDAAAELMHAEEHPPSGDRQEALTDKAREDRRVTYCIFPRHVPNTAAAGGNASLMSIG